MLSGVPFGHLSCEYNILSSEPWSHDSLLRGKLRGLSPQFASLRGPFPRSYSSARGAGSEMTAVPRLSGRQTDEHTCSRVRTHVFSKVLRQKGCCCLERSAATAMWLCAPQNCATFVIGLQDAMKCVADTSPLLRVRRTPLCCPQEAQLPK